MLRLKLPDFRTEAILVNDVSELPKWPHITDLFFDTETTSGQDKIASVNPWHNCELLGLSLIVDDEKIPYYIPLRHRGPNAQPNLPVENVLRWLQDILNISDNWIGHNCKYDCHVLLNAGLDISHPELIDTLSLCKLAPYEERFQYGLTPIMAEWFYKNIEPYEEAIHLHLKRGCKDYGLVPIDVMCPYACVDVLCVQMIYREMRNCIPAECNAVVNLEQKVTGALLQIERNGMKLDEKLLKLHHESYPSLLYAIVKQIETMTGFSEIRPHVNGDCKLLVVDTFGLPVLSWTEGGKQKKKQPSFDSDTLLAYRALCPERAEVFDWMIKYKELHKLFTSFTESYVEKQLDWFIHSDYNQIVRTGRTSCREPNAQQLSPEAKEYIIPSAPDRILVDIDYSQIEYRLIAHFVKAQHILNEYATNPKADYHQVVADICGIKRKEAKRVNFCLSYGGGRGKVIEILSGQAEVIERCGSKEAIEELGRTAYDRFHRTVPTLKPTTYSASNIARTRGYVRTIMGRRRYLPRVAHFRAFNSVIQGSAADLFKNALVNVHSYLQSKPYIKLVACVHDSFVLDMPKSEAESEVPKLIKIIEQIPEGVNLRVPIRADAKWSEKNWREC